jgi:phosphomannomutase
MTPIQKAQLWTKDPFDINTQDEVRKILLDPGLLKNSFEKDLTFGTGGIRGIMGAGTARINLYTIRAAAESLAIYIVNNFEINPSVFIGYDTRANSKEFALASASVFEHYKIKVYLSSSDCPTPIVSFGCRYYHCSAGVMITASHNPSQYNGFKVYGPDGAQLVSPKDLEIIKIFKTIRLGYTPLKSPSPIFVTNEVITAYIKELKKLQLVDPTPCSWIYSPLHGTGYPIIPKVINSFGFSYPELVEAQVSKDPYFKNAPSPNPEEASALELGTAILIKKKADLFIATDPDADRLGVVVLHKGSAYRLTGNQTACLAAFHICKSLKEQKKLPENGALIKTIVTTDLLSQIAKFFNIHCINVLTGFKYIAEKISTWENSNYPYQFLFGAEESYGSLYGTQVRDKDSINAALVILELAGELKKQNKTLLDLLWEIYALLGIYRESQISLKIEDTQILSNLRKNPINKIGSHTVIQYIDYLLPTDLPKSDVLLYKLEDQSQIVIRPSGTEPKIKIYFEVVGKKEETIEQVDLRLNALENELRKIFVC